MVADFQRKAEALAGVLDNIQDTLCVIDPVGVIIYVNRHWREFASQNDVDDDNAFLGHNYIDQCRSAAERGDSISRLALHGINDLVAGKRPEFSFEYPCHSPEEKRWFQMFSRCFVVSGQRYFLITHTNITERRSMEEALISQALLDGLTNIPNRRHFDNFLESEWRRCARLQLPLSVLLIDIDFFKQYNDSKGHLSGDYCLKEVARVLSNLARRPSDLCARYGGEEFAIVLGNCDIAHARIIAERALDAIRALEIDHPKSDAAPHITVSIGLASMTPEETDHHEQLISYTDQMLYSAKSAGRNTLCSQAV